MEKNYVAIDDLWPYVQEEYKKAEERHDLKGQQWCNWFLQLITCAEHKKLEVEDVH
jgi:hypothetical protein